MLNIAGGNFRNYTQKHHFYHIFITFLKFINYPVTKPHWITSFSIMLYCYNACLQNEAGDLLISLGKRQKMWEKGFLSVARKSTTCDV